MTTTPSRTGLLAGTWAIDPAHSTIGFRVRHLMVAKVRGTFDTFTGQVVVGDDGTMSVEAEIDVVSLNTRNSQRDDHLRSAHFLDVATYPLMTYRSTSVRPEGPGLTVEGALTLHGVTLPVPLRVEFNGINPGMGAGPVAGFEAAATIDRKAFGMRMTMPLETGGVVVGDTVAIDLDVELSRR